jgi:hypothetical protein
MLRQVSVHRQQSEEDYRTHLDQWVAREGELVFRSLDIPGLLLMLGCFRWRFWPWIQ